MSFPPKTQHTQHLRKSKQYQLMANKNKNKIKKIKKKNVRNSVKK